MDSKNCQENEFHPSKEIKLIKAESGLEKVDKEMVLKNKEFSTKLFT